MSEPMKPAQDEACKHCGGEGTWDTGQGARGMGVVLCSVCHGTGKTAKPAQNYSPHRSVTEYDGAFWCLDCGAKWGALPGEPSMSVTCVNHAQAMIRAQAKRIEKLGRENAMFRDELATERRIVDRVRMLRMGHKAYAQCAKVCEERAGSSRIAMELYRAVIMDEEALQCAAAIRALSGHAHAQHTGDLTGEKRACPCLYVEPCSSICTCRYPDRSGGCARCCTYGSLEQRTRNAERLSALVARHVHAETATEPKE